MRGENDQNLPGKIQRRGPRSKPTRAKETKRVRCATIGILGCGSEVTAEMPKAIVGSSEPIRMDGHEADAPNSLNEVHVAR
jgi:hypothetical protein